MVTRMRHFWARQQRRMTTRLLTWVVVALAAPVDAQPVATADDETAIRNARRESNRAIAAHDLAGIARHWMPDVHIVTSTSTQGSGRDVNGQRMGQQFVSRPDTVYVRTPATVDVLRSRGRSPPSAATGPAAGPSPTAWSRSPAPTWRSGARSATPG